MASVFFDELSVQSRASFMSNSLHASAKAFEERGAAYVSRGEYVLAEEPLQQSLTEYRMLGDRAGEARALDQLGKVYRHKPDLDGARDHHQEALSIFEALADRKGQGKATDHLGLVYSARGDYETARSLHEAALAHHRATGERAAETVSFSNLGLCCKNLGDFASAELFLMNALSIDRELHDEVGEAMTLGNLGNLCHFQRAFEKAQQHHAANIVLAQRLGNRRSEGLARLNRGVALIELHRMVEAIDELNRSHDLFVNIFDKLNMRRSASILTQLGYPPVSIFEMPD